MDLPGNPKSVYKILRIGFPGNGNDLGVFWEGGVISINIFFVLDA